MRRASQLVYAHDVTCGTLAGMILRSNLPRLRELASAAERVLDVGGWYQPFNLATHVIDLLPFDTRRQHDPLDPEDAPRFSAATWHVADVCMPPWPYPDKFFDFAICSHLRFTAKMGALAEHRSHYLTRSDIGRKLTEAESGLGFFWEGRFTYEEVFVFPREDYPAFRHRALVGLRGK